MTLKNIHWRPYQLECKKAIKEGYDKGITKQLIVSPTGSGKRLMAVGLMPHFQRSLFIAHREELIMQAYDEISNFWPMQVGIVKGPVFEIDKKIVVASVQTLMNRVDRIKPDTFQLIIIDELHHYTSPQWLKTVRHFTPKLLTGWTATPKRLDGISLSNIVQDLVFKYTIEDGIKDEFLAPIEAYQIRTPTDISRVKRTAGDFNQKELSEKVDNELRNNLIVMKYKEYIPGRQTIAYCVDIDHAYNLRNEFRKHGISCEAVVSDESRCPNRTEIVESFKKGEIDVLTNITILSEGFDYSDVGGVIMARPTQSETLYIQSIGRTIRLKSRKFQERFKTSQGVVLDFVDNTGNLSLINAWELEKDMPIEDRIFVPKEHKEKLIEEREKRVRRIQEQYGKDKKINLFRLPEVKAFNSEKMLEPATDKQLKWLKDMGIYVDDVEYTKAMASELISGLPAHAWQVQWLAQQNYDVSGKVTVGQYQKVKWMYDQKHKYAIKT